MASKKKTIKGLFKKDANELPGDKDLIGNSIVDGLMKKHGESMNDHSAEYTKLLKNFIINSQTSLEQKRKFKSVFFFVAIGMLVSSFLLFAILCGTLSFHMDNADTTTLAGFISSLIGLLSLYLIIPEIIARYLFNIKEDRQMTKIVKSIQTYDEKVFANMNINRDVDLQAENKEKMIIADLKKDAEGNSENPEVKKSESDT